jgi:hypothetical protein
MSSLESHYYWHLFNNSKTPFNFSYIHWDLFFCILLCLSFVFIKLFWKNLTYYCILQNKTCSSFSPFLTNGIPSGHTFFKLRVILYYILNDTHWRMLVLPYFNIKISRKGTVLRLLHTSYKLEYITTIHTNHILHKHIYFCMCHKKMHNDQHNLHICTTMYNLHICTTMCKLHICTTM